ncbi:cytochrome P450, partial [Gammaproteobacteria bacterium]|nr:cytochrome P450 [Gammaproteobacteria bacterium]
MAAEGHIRVSRPASEPAHSAEPPRTCAAPGPGGGVRLTSLEDTLPFVVNLEQQFGDVVYIENDVGPTFLVTRPDLIEQVFHKPNFIRNSALKLVLGDGVLSSSGDFWRQQRGLMQHRFKLKNLLPFEALITEYTSSMLNSWRCFADSGGTVDLYMEMRKVTLKIIAHAFFTRRIED